MWDFARIHGGLQSRRGHDAREIYLLQDQDDDNSTGKICVAKGIGNAVHYGFLTGNIHGRDGYPAWLPWRAISAGFPLALVLPWMERGHTIRTI